MRKGRKLKGSKEREGGRAAAWRGLIDKVGGVR
jgi:hypothetical protein